METSPNTWYALHASKSSHLPGEYEDAFAGNPTAGRFAVADGAAESSYAGLWARLLADGFVHKRLAGRDRAAWLRDLRDRWACEVDGPALPWYAEMKRSEGAFATFLGLKLKRTARTWRANAVGDSCLFQVRGDEIVQAFPLAHSGEFGNVPPLVGSRPGTEWRPRRCRGGWRQGDRFLLMTDALAHWFLTQTEAGRKPQRVLLELAHDTHATAVFDAWSQAQRTCGDLRDDDVTLLVVLL